MSIISECVKCGGNVFLDNHRYVNILDLYVCENHIYQNPHNQYDNLKKCFMCESTQFKGGQFYISNGIICMSHLDSISVNGVEKQLQKQIHKLLNEYKIKRIEETNKILLLINNKEFKDKITLLIRDTLKQEISRISIKSELKY